MASPQEQILDRMIVLMKADSAFTGMQYVKWAYPLIGTATAKKYCMLMITGEAGPPVQETQVINTTYYGEVIFSHIGQNVLTFTANVAVSDAFKQVAQYTADFQNLFRSTANQTLGNFTLSGSDGFVVDFQIESQTRYLVEGENPAWYATSQIPFTCIIKKARP